MKKHLFTVVVLMICLFSGCGSVNSVTKPEYNENTADMHTSAEERPSRPTKEGTFTESISLQTTSPEETKEQDPNVKPSPVHDDIPWILRQDLYRIVSQTPEKQEFVYLNKDGLHVQRKLPGQPEWRLILFENNLYWNSLDGSSFTAVFSYSDGTYGNVEGSVNSLVRIKDGSSELFSVPGHLYDVRLSELSPDTGMMLLSSGSRAEEDSLILLNDSGREIELGAKPYRGGYANVSFSPDGQLILYSFSYKDEQEEALVQHCRIVFPNGEQRELEDYELGLAISRGGDYLYLYDNDKLAFDESNLYIQKGLGTGERILLGRTANISILHAFSGNLGHDRWIGETILDYFSGPFFNLEADQIAFVEYDPETAVSDWKTFYCEKGEAKKLLFDQPAMPLFPQSLAYRGKLTSIKSGSELGFGVGGLELGLKRLNTLVWQTLSYKPEGSDTLLCDLYYVDEQWRTELIVSGVESQTTHISEDNRFLHYVKDGALYVMDLHALGREGKLLAQELAKVEDKTGSCFWVSYNGENVLWFDSYGNAYTVDRMEKEAYIVTDQAIDFKNVRPAGDGGFIYYLNGIVYYTESGNGEAVLNLGGDLESIYDCEGVYVRVKGLNGSFITQDGQHFEDVTVR